MDNTTIYTIISTALGAVIGVFVWMILKKKPTGAYQVPTEAIPNKPSQTDPNQNLVNEDLPEAKSPSFQLLKKGDPTKVAICFGINWCDPVVYGEKLPLRGCVNDSQSVYKFLAQKGFGKIWFNADRDATIGNFLKVWKAATKDLKDGDTLVLQMSRHGMSTGENYMDKDKEVERGGYGGDQAAVMHDGIIIDDCFWRLFLDLPKVKLIFINDSCHSGSQYKAALPLPGQEKMYRKARSVGKEYIPKPGNVLDLVQLEKNFGKPVNKTPKFDLISVSGCQDWQVSMDAYLNGKFQGAMTAGLLTILRNYPNKPLVEQEKLLNEWLKANGFEQNPKITIEGDPQLMEKPLF